ncbi:MAG: metallophosphoesterase [Candidatus Pacearchaeota archaeon]|nr:metallophosphoesterase [Candidatus Pacearchaeota archaeon]
MKILVIGDLHGRKPKIHFRDFDCMVQVGDVCDDREFRPFIKKWFRLIKKDRNSAPGMDELIIKKIGKRRFNEMEKRSLLRGRKILKYLNSFKKPVFFVPGNWDQSYGKTKIKDMDKNDFNYMRSFYDFYLGKNTNPKLIKGLKNIYDCQVKNNIFNKLNFLGYGLVSGNEKLKKGRILELKKNQILILKKKYKKIYSQLSYAYSKREKKFPTIFLSHNVPYKTKLDRIKNKDSPGDKKHLGSSIARKFCEKYKPLICVGGHVHEGKGKDRLGKTALINPGFGENAQVLIDIDESKEKVRSVKFFGNKK